MATFFPPPPVFTGGTQPYGQRQGVRSESGQTVNNPPFGLPEALAIAIEIAIIAQPDAWQYRYFGAAQPYAPRLLNPSITAVEVDNPPFGQPEAIATASDIIATAQPNPWTYTYFGAGQPFAPKTISPAIPGQSIDPPPILHGDKRSGIAALKFLWQPDPWTYAYTGTSSGRQPYGQRTLPPSLIAVQVDNPPFDRRRLSALSALIAQTQPDPWTYTFGGGWQPFENRWLVQTAFINNPPFDRRTAEGRAAIVSAWQPDPWQYNALGWQPYTPWRLSPGVPGQSADPPPPDMRAGATNAELIALNQPAIWPYSFVGGKQPYSGTSVPPQIEDNPPPLPGAGKRYQPPTGYLPRPAYGVPAKRSGFYERLASDEQKRRDAAAAARVVRPSGPPPLPSIAAAAPPRPAALPTASVGQADADASEALDTRDAMEAIAVLMKIGVL